MHPTVEKATEQFPRQFGDTESAKTFINEAVLEQNQAVSITVLHHLYSTGYGKENKNKYIEINSKQEFLTNMVFP